MKKRESETKGRSRWEGKKRKAPLLYKGRSVKFSTTAIGLAVLHSFVISLGYLWCHSLSHHYLCANTLAQAENTLNIFPTIEVLLLALRRDSIEQ